MASRFASSPIASSRIPWKSLMAGIPLALALSLVHGKPPDMGDTVALTPAPVLPPQVLDPELERQVRAIQTRYRQSEFARIKSIRYTVRDENDGSEVLRHWIWFPRQDSVFFQGKNSKGLELQAGYSRKNPWALTSVAMCSIDSAFDRDRFILFFPQLFGAGRGRELEMEGKHASGGEAAGRGAAWIKIVYLDGDHGRPWDFYEVLADTEGVIRAWTVRARESNPRPMRFEWSPPRDVDGLPLSLERKGPRGFSIRFSDVKIAWDRP